MADDIKPTQKNSSDDQYISMLEASKLCSYSQEYLSLLARRGRIQAKKMGRNWFVTRAVLNEYLQQQSVVISLPKNFFAHHNAPTELRTDKFGKPVLIASLAATEQSQTTPAPKSKLYEEFLRMNTEPASEAPATPSQPFALPSQKVLPNQNSNLPIPLAQVTLPPKPAPILPHTLAKEHPLQVHERVRDNKFETTIDKLANSISQLTQKVSTPPVLRPDQEEFIDVESKSLGYRFRRVRSFYSNFPKHPQRLTAIIVVAFALLFILVGGFAFGNADFVAQQIRKTFKDAETIQGHFAGTHANEVLVLDKTGKIAIFGHIETEGQLRSYAPNGVAPIVVDSMTKIENLNADYLDDLSAKDFTLAFVTKNGNVTYEDVKLEGNVEIGKTLTLKGPLKLLDELLVYGGLGVFSDAVFSKEVKLTGGNLKIENGNLVIGKGTIEISNANLVKNLNAEFWNGKSQGDFTLDYVVGQGNSTNKVAFFNGGLYGAAGAFSSIGVAGGASFGSSADISKIKFTVLANNFSVTDSGNVSISGKTTTTDLAVNGNVLSDLIATGSYDLGSATSPWDELFVTSGSFSQITISGNLILPASVSLSGSGIAGIDVREGVGNFALVSSVTFDASMFDISTVASESIVKLDWINGPASRAASETITGFWNFTAASTQLTGLELVNNASIGGNLTVRGTNTFSGIGSHTAAGEWNFDSNTLVIDAGTNRVGIGTATPEASVLQVVGTINGTPAQGVRLDITSDASGTELQQAMRTELLAGYTGILRTFALFYVNSAQGTSSDLLSTGSTTPSGNIGAGGSAEGAGDGANIGLSGLGKDSNTFNVGVWGAAYNSNASSSNIGVIGLGNNTTGPVQVGGHFQIGTTDPSLVSAALVADNANKTDPIFLARDGGSTVFSIIDGGNVGIGTTNPLVKLQVVGGASVSANFEVSGYTSASQLFGATLSTCISTQNLQWLDGRFACVDTQTAAGQSQIGIRESGGTFSNRSSLSFEAGNFNITFPNSTEALVKLDWTNGPSSRAANETITGFWNFTAASTQLTGLELVNNASIGGNLTVRGTNTFSGTGSHTAAGEWNFDSNTLVIDAGTNYVGVGTNTPGFTAAYNRVLTIGTGSAIGALELTGSAGPSAGIGVVSFNNTGAAGWEVAKIQAFRSDSISGTDDNGSGGLAFYTKLNSAGLLAQRLMIDSVGNVGIGQTALTSYPDQKLDVVGNILASTSGNVDVILKSTSANGSDGQFIIRSATTNERLEFLNGADANLLTIASSGNVGIGTPTPAASLYVNFSNPNNVDKNTAFFNQTITSGQSVNPAGGQSFNIVGNISSLTGAFNSGNFAAITQTTNQVNSATSYAYVSSNALFSGGPATSLANFIGFYSHGSNGGTTSVTNHYDFRASNYSNPTGLTVTNRYGLYIDYTNANVTNAYGVYQSSNTLTNYFAGNIGIGDSTPDAKLDVAGAGIFDQELIVTDALQVGGATSAAFSRFGTNNTTHGGDVATNDDVVISGALEVDGPAYFDGGIVFSQPSSAAGDFEVGGQVILADGSVGAPSLTFKNDSGRNSGLYRIGEDAFGITTGGVERLRFSTSGTSGSFPIEAATFKATTYTGDGALSLLSGGANSLTIDTGGAATLTIAGTNASVLQIGRTGLTTQFLDDIRVDGNDIRDSANAARITFTSTGTTGLITLSGNVDATQHIKSGDELIAAAALQVGGTATVSYSRFGTSATTHSNYISAAHDLVVNGDFEVDATAQFDSFLQVGTDTLHVNPTTGNIGIGTTNPTAKLNISGTSATRVLLVSATGSTPQIQFRSNNDDTLLYNPGDGFRVDVESVAGAFYINSATGNTGIGTLTPDAKLDVKGNILASTSGNVDLILKSTSSGGDQAKFTIRSVGTAPASESLQIFNGAGANLFTIASNGYVGIGTTGPSTNLDIVGNTLLGGDASVSQNLEVAGYSVHAQVFGAAYTSCNATTGKLLWNSTTGLFFCGTDQTVGGSGGGVLEVREYPGGFGVTAATISFEPGHFQLAASGSNDVIVRLDWGAGGPASLSQNETVTGAWAFNNRVSISGNFEVASNKFYVQQATGHVGIGTRNLTESLELIGNASISGELNLFGGLEAAKGAAGDVAYSRFGTATTGRGLSVASDILLSSLLEVDGQAYFDAGASVASNFEVGTSKFYVDVANSHVGIGTQDLTEALEVVGNASISGDIRIGGNDLIDSGGTTRITFDTDAGRIAFAGHASLSGTFEGAGTIKATTFTGDGAVTLRSGTGQSLSLEAPSGALNIGADANTSSITIARVGLVTVVSDDLRVIGNDIQDSGANTRITLGSTVTITGNLSVTGGTLVAQDASVSGNFEVGANKFYAQSSTGRIGIGTQNLSESLELVGNASISGTLTADRLSFVNASVSNNLEVANLASASGFVGSAFTGISNCNTEVQTLLWNSATGRFSCGLDSGASGSNLSVREFPGTSFIGRSTLSFDATHFNVTASGSNDVSIKLDWATGPASRAADETITGFWKFNAASTQLTGLELTNNASVGGNVVVRGTTTLAATSLTTLTASSLATFNGGVSVSTNLEVTGSNHFGINAGGATDATLEVGGTASISGAVTLASTLNVAGTTTLADTSITTLTTSGSVILNTASVSTNFEVGGYASASAFRGSAFSSITNCNTDSDTLLWDSATGRFSCGSDAGSAGGNVRTEEGGTTIVQNSSVINFEPGHFSLTASNSAETIVRLDWTNGPASRAANETITGFWKFTAASTQLTGLELTNGASISGAVTFRGLSTFNNGASFASNLELIGSNRLGINAGGVTDTALEVGGTASISILSVSGASTLQALTVNGRADFAGNVSVSGTFEGITIKGTTFTGDGAVALLSNGTNTLRLDASGAGTINIGDANAGAINIGRNTVTTNIVDDLEISGGDIKDSGAQERISFLTNGFAGLTQFIGYASFSQGLEVAGNLIGNSVLQIAGAIPTTYSRFGVGTATHTGSITQANDVFITGDLEIDGSASFDGFVLLNTASVAGSFEANNLIANNVIQAGGSTVTTYNRFGTSTTGRGLSTNSDVLIAGKLEVDGDAWFDSHASVSGNLEVGGIISGYSISSNASISGNLDVTGYIHAADGTAALPSYTFDNDQNTGLFRKGTDSFSITAGGIERLNLTSTTASISNAFYTSGGNVGVGTTTPNTGLVVGRGSLEVQSSHDTISAPGSWANIGSDAGLFLSYDSTNHNARLAAVQSGIQFNDIFFTGASFSFTNGSSERLRIDGNGNVGIGVVFTGPIDTKLEVGGTASISGKSKIFNSLQIQGSREVITDASSNTGDTGGMLEFAYDSTNNKALIRSVLWGAVYEPLYFQAGEYRWSISTTEKMLLDSNGNLGIGTTSLTDKFELAGTASISGKLSLWNSASISLNIEALGYASASSTFGSGLTNCSNTLTDKLLWASATGKFACAVDGGAGSSGNSIQLRELGVFDEPTTATISFEPGQFSLTASAGDASLNDVVIRLDWGAGGPASLSQDETVSGFWTFNNNASVASSFIFEVVSTIKTATYTGDGAVSVLSGGNNTLRLDAGGSGVINIGDQNATALNVGRTGITTTVNGSLSGPSSLLTIAGNASISGTFEAATNLIANGVIQAGGTSTVAYNRIGTGTTSHGNLINSSSDLLISGNLEINGTVMFDGIASASLFYASAGTAASPSFSFFADQDTGMFRPAVNQLGFSTLGVERIRINASGFVGVGDSSPDQILSVAGNIQASASGPTDLILRSFGPANPASNDGKFTIRASGSFGSDTLQILNGANTSLVTVSSNGFVGFGATDPDLNVVIANNDVISNQLRLRSQRTGIIAGSIIGGIDFASNDTSLTAPGIAVAQIRAIANATHSTTVLTTDLAFSTTTGAAFSEKMRITGAGSVGIWDTTPDATFEVVATGSGDILNVTSNGGSDGDYLTIENLGDIGIGITNPTAKLHINDETPATVTTGTGTAASNVVTALGATGGSTDDNDGTAIGGAGGAYLLTGGTGGVANLATISNTGGAGGAFTFTGGTGGSATVAGAASNIGGAGGAITIRGGTAGAASGGILNTGGTGGLLTLGGGLSTTATGSAGGGVAITGAAGSTTGSGGLGGNITFTAGAAGGDHTVNRQGGLISMTTGTSVGDLAGGAWSVTGGSAGQDIVDLDGTVIGPAGGTFTITMGSAGIAPVATVSSTGGAGGTFTISGGAGGAGSVAGSGTNTGGVGSAFAWTSGIGGAATGATSGNNLGGNGGGFTLTAGGGGAANTSTANNTGGVAGTLSLTGGTGGAATTAGLINTGGTGSAFSWIAGVGGAANGGSIRNVGGVGGAITLRAGTGGIGTNQGGNGGALTLSGGTAAVSSGSAGGAVTITGTAGTTLASGGNGGAISITGGAAGGTGIVARQGGAVTITGGASVGTLAGGAIAITAGAGGANPATGTITGAAGGALTLTMAAGGTAANADVQSTGGVGGTFTINGGLGGTAGVAGTGNNTGGGGSPITFTSGAGGTATGATSGNNTGGNGGAVTYSTGAGGAATNSTVTNRGGNSGALSITIGTGGAATTAGTTNIGGNGGAYTLTAGTGGAASGAGTTNTGGTGGAFTISAGGGGVGSGAGVGATGGNGGLLTLNGGAAAAASAAAGGGITLASGVGSITGNGGAGGAIIITGGAGRGNNTVARAGGAITLTAGASNGPQAGGAFTFTGGAAGTSLVTGTVVAPAGGGYSFTPGAGGTATGAEVSSTGGAAGGFTLAAATGGAASVAGTGNNTGGAGSLFSVTTGIGGAATGATSGTNLGGNGGALTLATSAGGAANTSTGVNTGGVGGAFTFTGGTGGATTTAGTTNTGGAGALITLTAGTGGAATGATTNIAGAGGAITITAGTGGAGSTAKTGVGGNLTLNGGTAGTAAGGGTQSGGGHIIFQTAATTTRTEAVRITSGSFVGIGTTAPFSKLDLTDAVGGTFTLSRNDTAAVGDDLIGKLQFWNNDANLTTQNLFATIEAHATGTIGTDAATGYLSFYTTGATLAGAPIERMRITDVGNIGIGDTAPAVKLEVRGTASASYNIITNALNAGRFSSAATTSYSRFGISTTTHSGSVSAADDLLISGDLEVDGSIFFDGTVNLTGIASASLFYAGNGTAASPSFSFRADQDTGMFRPDVNQLGFSTLGVERFRINASGNIGLADSSPEEILSVAGNIQASTSGNVALILNSTTEDDAKFTIQTTATAGSVARLDILGSASQAFLSIASSGNVGIGTTNPSASFQIHAAAGKDSTLYLSDADVNTGMTNIAPTQVFGLLEVGNSTSGGLVIKGLGETNSREGLGLVGIIGDVNPSDNTAAVYIDGARKSGAGKAAVAARETVFEIQNDTVPIFTLQGNSNVGLGIGADDPDYSLEIASASANFAIRSTDATASISFNFFPAGGASTSNQAAFTLRAGGSGGAGERLDLLNGADATIVSIASSGRIGLGERAGTSLVGKLHLEDSVLTSGATAVGGYFASISLSNSTVSGFQFGNRFLNNVVGGTAGTSVGQFIRMTDNTALSNTVRGLEVQAFSGTNTAGINTGIAAFGKTFGVQGTTDALAGGVSVPAGVFADLDNGSAPTAGNALRAYTDNATSANLAQFYQEISAFSGTGLLMNFANNAGTFTGKFLDFQKGGTNKFTVTHSGQVGIGLTTPTAFLSLASSTATVSFDFMSGGDTEKRFKFQSNYQGAGTTDRMDITNGEGTTLATLASNGNFALGTIRVDSKFEIAANATTTNIVSISATNLTTGNVLDIRVPVSSSFSGAAFLVRDTNNVIWASLSSGGRLSIRRSLFAHQAVVANCTGVGTPVGGCVDVAENYATNDLTLEPGDVIAVDASRSQGVRRATDRDGVLGIVSSNPGVLLTGGSVIMGNDTSIPSVANNVPIALAGRVPVKVSLENGAIAAGDHLMLSPTLPGYAARATEAGMTIGIALEAVQTEGQKVMTFVNLDYWAPTPTTLAAIPFTSTASPSSTASSSISVTSGGGVDVLGTIVNAAEVVMKKVRVTGDIIAQGAKKTYFAFAEALPNIDPSTWASRPTTISVTAPDEVKALFQGTAAQAADQSKVDLAQDNGNYLATYGVDSTRGEIQLSGTSDLVNGEAKVFFDESFTAIISHTIPIRVLITPTSDSVRGQLYVATKNQFGFIAKELNGTSSGKFDWLVIARRNGFDTDTVITPAPTVPINVTSSTATPIPTPGTTPTSTESVTPTPTPSEPTPPPTDSESSPSPSTTPEISSTPNPTPEVLTTPDPVSEILATPTPEPTLIPQATDTLLETLTED